MLHDVSTGWAVHHRAIWEMPPTTTEISSAFESQINIEMQSLFTLQSAPQMFSGAGTMWFSPAFRKAGISNIEFYSDNNVQIIGDKAFLTDKALSGVFLDRMASLSLSRGDEQEIWHVSIAFVFQNDDEITTVRAPLPASARMSQPRLSANSPLTSSRFYLQERRIAGQQGYDRGAIHASVPHVSRYR